MEDPEIEPGPESSRYLLPNGCKDLVDALNHGWVGRAGPAFPHCYTLSKYPQGSPAEVSLPDPVSVSDLAEAIHLPVYQGIRVLLHIKIFVTPNDRLEFFTAKSLCSLCGVEATRSG